MFTKEMVDKIDKFLRENLDIMFEFKFNGLLLFWGGALKGFIMDTPIRDYDFVLLTQEEDNILDFIKKYKLKYEINPGHGYTIFYNDLLVGLSSKKDLTYNSSYNTDLLFYDIHRKQFIPIGIKQALVKRQVLVYDYQGYPRIEQREHMKNRLKTAKKFIQFMNNDNNRVRIVRKNKYYRRLLIGFLKHPSKIKKLFRR